jgi:hypothetical protein
MGGLAAEEELRATGTSRYWPEYMYRKQQQLMPMGPR